MKNTFDKEKFKPAKLSYFNRLLLPKKSSNLHLLDVDCDCCSGVEGGQHCRTARSRDHLEIFNQLFTFKDLDKHVLMIPSSRSLSFTPGKPSLGLKQTSTKDLMSIYLKTDHFPGRVYRTSRNIHPWYRMTPKNMLQVPIN